MDTNKIAIVLIVIGAALFFLGYLRRRARKMKQWKT
jgi:hypothetical protein